MSSNAEIAAHSGQRVRIVGQYEQQDVRMAQRPPPRYLGHVAVVLDDHTRIYLEPIFRKEAIRPAPERKKLDGKRVVAVGTLWEYAPQPDDGSNSLTDPCLTQVESVEKAPEK